LLLHEDKLMLLNEDSICPLPLEETRPFFDTALAALLEDQGFPPLLLLLLLLLMLLLLLLMLLLLLLLDDDEDTLLLLDEEGFCLLLEEEGLLLLLDDEDRRLLDEEHCIFAGRTLAESRTEATTAGRSDPSAIARLSCVLMN
jgi:hypothetical protein